MTEARTRRPLRNLRWGVLCLAALFTACDANQGYVIWPQTARTGETIAILFNTEWDTYSDPGGALLDASTENVVVQVTDSLAWTESVTPRLVIEAPAAVGSKAVAGVDEGSFTGLVAIFDLPDPWPNGALTFPDDFTVVVEYKGQPTFGDNVLTVQGPGGAPIVFSYNTPPELLELHPMLRLRPAWDSAMGQGFDPAWEIGGLEFTLRYSQVAAGDVTGVRALGNGEATAGMAMATELAPQGADKLWRIVLLHPPGFQLPDRGCDGLGDCYAGRWALLDLPLDIDTTGLLEGEVAFDTTDFAIEDLRIVDRDGAELHPVAPGDDFFHLYASNNVIPLPEPGMLLLLTSGVLGLVVVHRLERRRGGRSAR